MKKKSKTITSLREYAKDKNRVARNSFLSHEERVGQLETEMLRLVDFALELQERLDSNARFVRKLLDSVKKLVADNDRTNS